MLADVSSMVYLQCYFPNHLTNKFLCTFYHQWTNERAIKTKINKILLIFWEILKIRGERTFVVPSIIHGREDEY